MRHAAACAALMLGGSLLFGCTADVQTTDDANRVTVETPKVETSGETPDQVVASGAFRYTVESVQRADEIQGLGLPNVRSRLRALYGQEASVHWVEDEGHWRVEISLPATRGPEPATRPSPDDPLRPGLHNA